MTDEDREIIGYLLYHNQKMFQTNQDGGYAAPLISKGIIKVSLRHGQVFDPLRVPFVIPDYAWSVFKKNKKYFLIVLHLKVKMRNILGQFPGMYANNLKNIQQNIAAQRCLTTINLAG